MQRYYKPVRIIWRFLLLLAHLLFSILLAIPFLNRSIRPGSLAASLVMWWHRRICSIFGMYVTTEGKINSQATLFVVNHISWFDIPTLGSVVPVHFLSKDEVNSWPIIGWLAAKAGTLFIKRGEKGASTQSIQDIENALRNGSHVIIFPEATTTDGTSVRKFHSRLFQAAINAGVQVQAIALRYPHPRGVHPKVPYIGDTQLIDSTLGLMSESRMQARLHFFPAITARNYSRDQLALMTREQILTLITSAS
ncbi:MAG: 1-acyl-sn-glycerol-3-phosphate acyltransferase [Gammaproteobacteria bacterium]|nr:MAG: 1-acyl-sn-glycerol-3-phosphate acyltransferase [Gammaproteobacteria bacterium]